MPSDPAIAYLVSAKELFADPTADLRPYIRDGRIVMLPAKRTRRRQLLDRVAQAFEPGRRYPEPAVDEILKRLFDDHCALRRYLVEEDFMSRTPDGQYWRTGGAVPFGTADPGAVGSGAVGSGAVGSGAVGSGAVGSGADARNSHCRNPLMETPPMPSPRRHSRRAFPFDLDSTDPVLSGASVLLDGLRRAGFRLDDPDDDRGCFPDPPVGDERGCFPDPPGRDERGCFPDPPRRR